MRVRALKTCDALLGRLLTYCLPGVKQTYLDGSVDSILVIRPGGIGDAVLLIPALHALKAKFPAAHVTILAERRNAAIFDLCPLVDKTLRYDHSYDLLTVLRGTYDVVIDTEQWHRLSAVVTRLTGASISIGYATNERGRLFTRQIPYSHDDYEAESFLHLLEPLGIHSVAMPELFIDIQPQSSARMTAFMADYVDTRFVTIFPGASVPERRWGAERFRRVAELLVALGIGVVVVGGKEDCQQGEVITGGGVGLNLAGLTSLAETAAVIQKSSLLLSGDSGVLHIAVGLGVPTVSLFGPGRAKKWAPRGERHMVINKNIPCSPCTTFGTTPSCPENVACMRDITVDEVFNAVTMLLTSTGAMASRCCKRDWLETA